LSHILLVVKIQIFSAIRNIKLLKTQKPIV